MKLQTEIQRQPLTTQGTERRRVWLPWTGGILFALLCVLSLVYSATPAQAYGSQGTIPAAERTELLGPIDQITPASEWIVAGVPVHLSATTPVDERVMTTVPGAWARVEGMGDGAGGINAARIKILPPHPNVKLEGPLTALTSNSAAVDAITVALSTTTLIVGNPQPGVDRVGVRAVVQTGSGLLAIRIQKEGAADAPPVDPIEDAPNVQDGVQLYGIIRSRPSGVDTGQWIVSGVPVSVTAQTILIERVGPLIQGAWVQVQGTVDANGDLVARRMRTISRRRHHRVEGVLQELTQTSLQVGGISLLRNAATKLSGNPTIGQPVEVEAELLAGGDLLAVKVKANNGQHEDPERHTVEFVGRVESLPTGALLGEWQVSGRRVLVTGVTSIDEHKGLIGVGVLVKVEGVLNQDQSINALEISVKRGEEDDNKPEHDHEFVRLVGVIEALPANGLLGEWTVSGKMVVVTERTELDHGATYVISDTVKVKGYAQNDGSLLAREIEKEDEGGHHGGEGQEVKFTGIIKALPPSGLLGQWTVDGKQVMVNGETELKDGAYAVGDTVDVKGRQEQNGVVIAKKIEKHSSGGNNGGGEGQEVTFTGDIQSLPPSGLRGEWTVDDKTVMVNAQTELKDSHYVVGDSVKVDGRQEQNGVIVAKKIEKTD